MECSIDLIIMGSGLERIDQVTESFRRTAKVKDNQRRSRSLEGVPLKS